MKSTKMVALVLFLILLLSGIPVHGENKFVEEIKGEKTLVFPFGTSIHIRTIKGDVSIKKFCGIYGGARSIILSMHSENGGKVEIDYRASYSSFPDKYRLLIICPDKWKDAMKGFIQHKEKHGIPTIAVGLDEIYGGIYFKTKGKDDAEKIKYFIKDAIENWGIEYVLLVGGKKLLGEWWLPVRYAYLNDRSSSWEYERRFISDLYYADIYDGDGNFSSWDTNGNGYYGEYDHEMGGKKLKDRVDLVPDVYLGRLMARSKNELKRVLANIIEYEEGSAPRRAVMCGGDLYLHDPWNVAEGEHLLDAISGKMEGYEIEKIYASEGLTANKINEAINKGAEFVFFEGAGNHHLWATHPKDDEKWIFYYERNIMQLKNENLPIVMTSGARLGQFNKTRECFNWFFVSKGKAVASIGSTGLCWIGHGPNITTMFLGNLHVRMAEKMAQEGILGEAWGDSITEYLCNFSWKGVAEAFHMKAAEEFEIFGDPSLKIGGYGHYASLSKNGRFLHVGGKGAGNYSTIEEALNNASNGDTIIVHSGTYNENFSVNISVAIIGKNATLKTGGIEIYADDVKIENLTIEGYGKGNGITCYGDAAYIKNSTLHKFNNTIEIYGKKCRISNSILRNSMCGVWLNKSKDVIIDNNTIYNIWYGVWGEKCRNVSIIQDNFSYNHWYAVWMEGKDGIICCNDFIHNWYSVYFYNSNGFLLKKNHIVLNIHGPQFVNSSFCSVEGNVIERNEHYGIYFGWRSRSNSIFHNDFVNNAQNARDDGRNKWEGNYWSDYIGVKVRFLYFLHFPYYIQPFSFDWRPSINPQNIY